MARTGVSYLDVAEAAMQLTEQNTYPTIEAVRQVLGTGSNSTINRHLRLWREKQGNALEAQKGLPESLLVAVKALYKSIQEESTGKMEAFQAEAKQQLQELQIQMEDLKLENNRLLQHNASLEEKLTDSVYQLSVSKKLIDQLNQTIEKKEHEAQFLKNGIQDKKEEIDRLTQQIKHSHDNLDHYRESIRAEREKEKQKNEVQIKNLEQQIYHQQTKLLQAEKKTGGLIQQIESSEKDKKIREQELSEALKKCGELEKIRQHYDITSSILNEKYDKLSSEYAALSDESKEDKKEIRNLALKSGKMREQAEAAERALKKAEDKLNQLDNKHLFLMQKKTELAFQLKQMQLARG